MNENRKPVSLAVTTMGMKQAEAMKQAEDDDGRYYDASDNLRTELLQVIPRTFQNRARLLYDRLASPQARAVLEWDDIGRVSVRGQEIPNSNIVDYISDLTRHRKTCNPPGWETFAAALSDLPLPADLIGNDKYRELIQKQQGRGIAHDAWHPVQPHPATPRRARPVQHPRAPPRGSGAPHQHAQSKGKNHGKAPRRPAFVKWTPWRP